MTLLRRLFLLPLICTVVSARPLLPVVTEAELVATKEATCVADATASGHAYVTAVKEWTTLARLDVPSMSAGQRLAIWVRMRGLPVALKTAGDPSSGIKSKELAWIHHAPSDWEWRKMGVFTPEQLGGRILLMRGVGVETTGGVDAIFIGRENDSPATSSTGLRAGSENAPIDGPRQKISADDNVVPVHAQVVLDWDATVGTATRRQFSLNAFRGFTPELVRPSGYAEGIAYMNPAFLRYHASGMTSDSKAKPGQPTSAWLDYAARRWDTEKIAAALDAFSPIGVERMICISNWPTWMMKKDSKALDPAHYDDFAHLCAELVRIVNIDQKRGIEYFEITNERDFVYWRDQLKAGEPVQVTELAQIYNLAAKAMRAVDPSIKLGGPASCRGESAVMAYHREFARLTLPQLDFFSFHCYATGEASTPDPVIYDITEDMGEMIRDHVRMLADLSPDRHIELCLDEYNINYSWKEGDLRMRTNKGAVFDSLFFIEAVRNGLDIGAAWNECDGTYGKMEMNTYKLRPSAHIFHYFNHWMVGRSVSASTDHPRAVVPFAVENTAAHLRSWVLVNRSSASNTVSLSFADGMLPSGKISTACVSASGLETGEIAASLFHDEIMLPPNSVTFYSTAL
jgi:hypothetical protein